MSITWTEEVFPFGSSGNSPGQLFANDIIVEKNQPGIELVGEEANNVWAEYREVSGDSFLTTNATYVSGTGWAQVNASSPSYALAFRSTGEIDRLYAPSGAGAPLAWQTIDKIDPSGNLTQTPLTGTLGTQIAQAILPTWNAPGVVMTAFKINVTDTSSNASSKLIDAQVNGTSVFTVFKNGTINFGGGGSQTANGFTQLPGGVTLQWGYKTLVPSDGSAVSTVNFGSPFATSLLQFVPSIDTGAADSGTALSLKSFNGTNTGFQVVVAGGAPGSTVTVRYFAIGY